jgi:hypothetical protein
MQVQHQQAIRKGTIGEALQQQADDIPECGKDHQQPFEQAMR